MDHFFASVDRSTELLLGDMDVFQHPAVIGFDFDVAISDVVSGANRNVPAWWGKDGGATDI